MSDFIEEFRAHMAAHGFTPKNGQIVADDKWHPAYYGTERGAECSGTYSLTIKDGKPLGCVFTRKDEDTKYGFPVKGEGVKISAEEMKRLQLQQAKLKKEKDLAEEKLQRKISARLEKYFKGLPNATADHPYLKKKGIGAEGVKLRAKGNELVLPLRGIDGKIWTIQRITPDGKKYLFKDGRKKSSYLALAKSKEDLSLFLVVEGYATGKTVRDATGKPVIVAIDSGNLKSVLIALKQKYPNAQFMICADNDAYTRNAKKELWNVGIEKAKAAAEAIGGAFIVNPPIVNDKNTDFDDLRFANGLEAVADIINAAIERVQAKKPEAVNEVESETASSQPLVDGSEIHSMPEEYGGEIDYEAEAANINPLIGDFGMQYKILGYNKGVYYYFPYKERQIVALSAASHTLPNLFRLDDLDNWQTQFGGTDTSEKKIVMYATNALMQTAKLRGVFKEEDRVRGCGAWLDDGRKILHCGDVLYVDGVETKFDQLQSEFTYIAAVKLMRPADVALKNHEAYALRKICEAVTWENKLSGSLLAGWLVIAPVCGALDFRPHIYITGEAESGKSTVVNKIIKPVLGRMSVNLDGGTTEPAVRETMEHDARPLVYDEAEKSPHMPAVIELARKASSGSSVKKFGQGVMKVRFAACFSAINPPVNKTADESRISFMVIKKNRRPTAIEEYNALLDLIEATLTPDYSNRMIARTMENMDALFLNIATFQKAARKVIKGARASQVIGTMLAGLYLLSRTDIVTPEFAEEWVAQHDWTNHTIIEDDTDPVRLLQYLSSCLLRYQAPGMNVREQSIGDLIVLAHRKDETADKLLRYNGIAVKDDRVYVASRSQNLEKLLRDTDWSMKWTRMLSNIEGAEAFKIFYFGVGFKTSGVSLPIKLFVDGPEPKKEAEQLELPQDDFEDIPF